MCKQISLNFLLRTFLILESIQRFPRDLLSNHKKEAKSAETFLSSTVVIPQLCCLGIFNLNQKLNSCTNANNFWR